MLATLLSASLQGIHALSVHIEVNTGQTGDPRTILVGLPDAAVKESIDRVSSAITNSGFKTPETRTTINLAPGHVKKEGPAFDLPIALGLLASTRQMSRECMQDFLIAGELSLSGTLRPVRGALAMALLAKKEEKRAILLPEASAHEAALVEGLDVYPVASLDQAVRFLEGQIQIAPIRAEDSAYRVDKGRSSVVDFSEIKGQQATRRAVEVAVAGGHNLLMVGPPGSGKSMISKRIPSIMPEPCLDEFLEILAIQSAAGVSLDPQNRRFERPFRSPHHTISDVGLIGGGSNPAPGEISLAHHGVLFMDELPEFKRSALEVLRQPLEDGEVTISRSAGKITLPCGIMLVAAMNPCPCGYMGDKQKECRCNPNQVQRYRSRISGPLLDRIDIHIETPALSLKELQKSPPSEDSAGIRKRIADARSVQAERFKGEATTSNAGMSQKAIREHCRVSESQAKLLEQAMTQLNLSARAYDRILKVARTIADLENAEVIGDQHLLEAIQYRTLDRNVFY